MSTLAELKRAVAVGDVFEVTNHYITREDHPCYGTRRGAVARVTAGAFYLYHGDGGGGSRIEWPKASQVTGTADSFTLLGGGVSQGPADPFLTLRRVP